jgi:hypothetical protein
MNQFASRLSIPAAFIQSSGQAVGAAVKQTAVFFSAAARRGGGRFSSHFRAKKLGKEIKVKKRSPATGCFTGSAGPAAKLVELGKIPRPW